MGLPVPVDTVPAHELGVVHLVAVKVGAVYAGKLGLAAYGDPAAAAHAGAVHHDGVQGDNGLDPEGLRGLGDELHHGDGANGQNLIVLAAGFQQLLELYSDEAVLAVGAVVGH